MFLGGDVRLFGVGADDVKRPFSRIRDVLHAEDFVYANLEGAFHDEVDPYEHYSKMGWLHPGTAGARALLEGNFAAVGLANNVIVGGAAIKSTISILDGLGIAYTGAGMDLQSARAPAVVERNGVRYGFLQRTSIFWPFHHKAVPKGPTKIRDIRYHHGNLSKRTFEFYGAPGVATIRPHTAYEPSYESMFEAGGAAIIHTWPDADDLEDFVDDIKALRPQVDVLVTSNHWRVTTGLPGGPPIGRLARDFRIEVAHAAIDAGADIVASHGTHFIEEIEVYKGKAIFYGLGELFFGLPSDYVPHYDEIQRTKLLARIEVKGKSINRVSCRLLNPGGYSYQYETVLRTPGEEPKAIEYLQEISSKFNTKLHVGKDDITVVG